ENVLTHGTGALNVDGCRVEIDIDEAEKSKDFRTTAGGSSHIPLPNQSIKDDLKNKTPVENHHPLSLRHNALGRFPANLIHDGSDEVVALFPETQPAKQGFRNPRGKRNTNAFGDYAGQPGVFSGHTDNGGTAARFFYCAKASQQDRDSGTEDRNNHPTVKPLSLMRYLCRLITPPGGIILDPFMGSGSTGKAAMLEGFKFIGIELQPEYFDIACKRIEDAQAQGQFDFASETGASIAMMGQSVLR
ncbi:site-specific DNA-methyltransferase, partial [Chromatium okenii]|uniref:site-specific DNA-methyltransferase n=1 Tax=Chromatium okenii TaxID=61644 RepID=UPI0026F27D39